MVMPRVPRERKRPTVPSSMVSDISNCRRQRQEQMQPTRFLLLMAINTLLLSFRGGCNAFVSPQILPRCTTSTSSIVQMVASSPPPSPVVSESPEEEDGTSRKCRFMYMTEEQDMLLKEKGDLEASLMQTPTALEAVDIAKLVKKQESMARKAAGGGGGFGGGGFGGGAKKTGGKKKKKQAPKKAAQAAKPSLETETLQSPEVQALTEIIREDGLVRIDNVLTADKADELREYLIDLRKRAKDDIETGEIEDSQQRFADVLLNQNRCDLKIPLGPKPVHEALLDVLDEDEDGTNKEATPSLVRKVIEGVFDHYGGSSSLKGSQASLWELNCFMSNSGARRQLVHADCVCLDAIPGLDHTDTNSASDPAGEPILLTCFIALQDIDPSMGPTVFMPKTHNIRSHNVFFETGRDSDSTKTESYSPKNELMKSSKAIVGAPIPKGSCIIFDPRVLHCAGANQCSDPDKTRALFYMTFKNPKVDSPGCPSTSGYGIANAELTMDQLVSDLLWMEKGGDEAKAARRVPLMAASP